MLGGTRDVSDRNGVVGRIGFPEYAQEVTSRRFIEASEAVEHKLLLLARS